jgi:hypothetical protein
VMRIGRLLPCRPHHEGPVHSWPPVLPVRSRKV